MRKKWIFAILTWMMCITQLAAHSSQDFLRSTGKIYTVVIVIVIILLGLAYYLFKTDKRLSKLENKINKNG